MLWQQELLPWAPLPGPQSEAYFCQADELFYGGRAGGGKRIWNEELVPVPLNVHPSGFKKHGDLQPGDFVYSPSGYPVEVIAVLPVVEDTDAYRLSFDTGEQIIADGEHLWSTWTDHERGRCLRSSEEWRAQRKIKRPSRAKADSQKPWVSESITKINMARVHQILQPSGSIRTTREISLTLRGTGGRANHSIDVTQPLIDRDQDVPIEPYLFGLWIGDGISKAPRIGMTTADWSTIEKHLPSPDRITTYDKPPRKQPFEERVFLAMRPALHSLGVFGKKRIPPRYLRAAYAQRVALLQGILDTDGTCDARGQIEVGFSNKALADDLHELVSSLGIKATLRQKTTSCQTGQGKDHYRIKFLASFPAFRLSRKAERQKLAEFRPTVRRRYIVDVQPIPSVPMRCIKVASRDGLYLVGRSFIPTHNTDLLLGLAITQHLRTLILRREATQLRDIVSRSHDMLGNTARFNGQLGVWRGIPGDRMIEFGGCDNEHDKQKYKGRAHDLKGFDELPDFTESQYLFISAWNRTTVEGQRCRSVATGNPPSNAEGEWVIRRWAPWLDGQYAYPAKPGELRWYAMIDGKDTPCEDGTPFVYKRETIEPKSRTFIPASLTDNPYLMRTGYGRTLQNLPEPLRSQLLYGDFSVGRDDDPWQLIPTDWVRQAQARWREVGHLGLPLSAVGLDVARGGKDCTVTVQRYGNWYGEAKKYPGEKTPDGQTAAQAGLQEVKDGAKLNIDVIGIGASAYDFAKIPIGSDAVAVNFGAGSDQVDRTGKFGFVNLRAEYYWKLREALDPIHGDNLALPPDAELLADLCAPIWELRSGRIKVEDKDEIKKRLGRSPDVGDAVVLASIARREVDIW